MCIAYKLIINFIDSNVFFADKINILLARKLSFSHSASLMIKAIIFLPAQPRLGLSETFSKRLYNVHLSERVSRRDGNIYQARENNELS